MRHQFLLDVSTWWGGERGTPCKRGARTGVAWRCSRALALLFLFVFSVLALGSCSCGPDLTPPHPQGILPCVARTSGSKTRPGAPSLPARASTATAGTISGSFSVSASGEATYSMPLVSVPGRAGVEPTLALMYDSAGGDGVLGMGFSISGASAITRCPQNLAEDGEIRAVHNDPQDRLCLDGKRLVREGGAGGTVTYRTLPDTLVKVVGHFPNGEDAKEGASFFEAFLPSGLVVTYGKDEGGRPRAPGGVTRAWLAQKARDVRGNAMTYAYCFAEAEDHTAEYALEEIRYTSFEGTPAVEPSRAVKLVYGSKDPADVRVLFAEGMQLQNTLRLEAIEMLGPGDALVRSYGLTYDLGPTTKRTRLTEVKECGSDKVCKPPMRFQYSVGEAAFTRQKTVVPVPTSERASPMLIDSNGDGRGDLVVPDTRAGLSTPVNPTTEWRVARNLGPNGSPGIFASPAVGLVEDWVTVASPSGPADPRKIQPELGTGIDYNADGRTDIFVHDVYGASNSWHVLLAQKDGSWKRHDTGIARPFPLGASPPPPMLTSKGASVHLADVNGDGVPDLIQCQDHSAHLPDPFLDAWMVHLWRPARGGIAADFDPEGQRAEALTGIACDVEVHTLDVDADGKVDLLLPEMTTYGGTEKVAGSTYRAWSRRADGTWRGFDTKLPLVEEGDHVVFLDVNGDGLPDAVMSKFGAVLATLLYTYMNTGHGFSSEAVQSVGWDGISNQTGYFGLAVPIDFNGDGRQDLLMPMPQTLVAPFSGTALVWAVLLSRGAVTGTTFSLVDAHIPFEEEVSETIHLAYPEGLRAGDVNGDGAPDVLLPIGGFFSVFESRAASQDLLVGVADGMNAHIPEDSGFTPNVAISYGHLTDDAVTGGVEAETPLYRARSDGKNGCDYPRACAVGPRRVVRAYALHNGADAKRHFEVYYRDGRYHRLGRGFLGFGERIVADLETRAGTSERYDNITFDEKIQAFPFVGQVVHEARWLPGLPQQEDPSRTELSFADVERAVVPTGNGKTYLTVPTWRRVRREQAFHVFDHDTVEMARAYVATIEAQGAAVILRDTTTQVTDFDAFGNIKAEDVSTSGVDFTLHLERSFKNDTERWILGQLTAQTECSAAAMLSACRTLTRTPNAYGEVENLSTSSDDGSPDTRLSVTYARDRFGNVRSVNSDDAHGHHRVATATYDEEGLFPKSLTNAENHTTLTEYDPAFGVLGKLTDPNTLVTKRVFDSLGRLAIETRPDGTETKVTFSRTKDGGKAGDGFRVMRRSTTTGGADDAVEFDSLGRPIRWFWHGAEPEGSSRRSRVMQEIVYDALGEHVARRSVPTREDASEGERYADAYRYDAAGREIWHQAPWGAVATTAYEGLFTRTTDARGYTTVNEQDPLGRTVSVTDAEKGITRYTYGPFGFLHTVTDPGGALTRFGRDAMGRVRRLDDPDRGTTTTTHDGFGEVVSSTDALGRVVTWAYDGLGRTVSRLDQQGAERQTTTWTWDKAAHGVGRLSALSSPDGDKTYTYTPRSQLETLTLSVVGTGEAFTARLGYDDKGRVETITYPTPSGAVPFVVKNDYDRYGHTLAVYDVAVSLPYWRLTDVDDAGRTRDETFGNDVSTEREHFADRQALKSIATRKGATAVQDLAYAYDEAQNLQSRTDALQPDHKTERFRHDGLERLTCAYFSPTPNPFAICASSYRYQPSGNLAYKSDIGALAYGDPLHPHAVTGAGSDGFAYNSVGNQIARPGGMLTYTPFDLPKTITQAAGPVSFGYDGDEQRIRKTTPTEETLYFEGLYERVTSFAAPTEHRYYVRSPERVVAVVTRGGKAQGTRFVHVDHLGSVESLTDESGMPVEKRSYDAFGQRRSPVWGQPGPVSFASLTTLGFTGHEDDGELGLVNMKGRVFDPKVGRFLSTDPVVSNLLSGQSWNPYSYVANRPLSMIDPSGLQEAALDGSTVTDLPDGWGLHITGPTPMGPPPPPPRQTPDSRTSEAAEVGAKAPPVDVGTTGNAPAPVAELFPVFAAVPLGAPGLGGPPLGAPGAPGIGPLNAPGPFQPDAFGPGSFIEPAPPGMVPLEAPGVPVRPGVAPGLGSGLLGGVVFILAMGMVFDGDVHPTLPPPEPKEYDIVPYKDRAPGFQNHHGILDIWAHHNIPGYVRRPSNSTTIRLLPGHHKATITVYGSWLRERGDRGIKGPVDWTTITPREILNLSERQLDAAEVPGNVRKEYYRQFNDYIYGLK
jgi:RHS repeat-associated protein